MADIITAKNVKMRGRLKNLFKNCPTSEGWFGGLFITDDGDAFRATGKAAFPASPGMVFQITGDLIENKYGEQIKAYDGKMEIMVDDYKSVLGYFASSGFRMINRMDAMNIARTYDSNAINMINHHPDIFQSQLCFDDRQMTEIQTNVANTFGRESFMAAFPSLSVSMINKARKCDDLGGSDADKIKNIQLNPYILLQVNGIGFKTADKVAMMDCHIPWNHKTRLMYVMLEAMNEFMRQTDGASYCDITAVEDWNKLYQIYLKCCGGNATVQFMSSEISRLRKDHVLVVEQENHHVYLYTRQMHDAEALIVNTCTDYIRRLDKNGYGERLEKYESNTVSAIHAIEQNFNMKLDPEQVKAVKTCIGNPLSCISGRPGTGKSSVIRMIGKVWCMLHGSKPCQVLIMAPTGKAVNRLSSEIYEFPVATIARVMTLTKHGQQKYPQQSDQVFVDGNSFIVSADTLVMIDEASMIDVMEAAQIFDMFGQGHLVFVGDKNQLPPIEPGSFFRELTACGEVPVTELLINHRTEPGSQVISDNAQKILDSDIHFTYDDHFKANPCDDKSASMQAAQLYQSLCANGVEKKDIMMLCPVHKSEAGVDAMNRYLQDIVNRYHPHHASQMDKLRMATYNDDLGFDVPLPKKMTVKNPDLKFRVGDRVMNTKNHADMAYEMYPAVRDSEDKILSINIDKDPVSEGTGVYNGDFGTITRFYYAAGDDPAYVMIVMDDWRVVSVPVEQLSEFCLGYCVTIHKSQGSEAQHVIILFPDMLATSSFYAKMFLSQNMLYTAVTRARRSVTLIGNMGGVKRCVDRPLVSHHTQLRAWLYAALMPLNMKRKMKKGVI